MNQARWDYLMSNEGYENGMLTEEEIKEGWHFCMEMDGLLANSNEPDGDCFCSLNTKRKYE